MNFDSCGSYMTVALGGVIHLSRDGLPYCEQDYQMEFGVSCAGCGGYITGKVLQVRYRRYCWMIYRYLSVEILVGGIFEISQVFQLFAKLYAKTPYKLLLSRYL